jgi:hypothetical protein
MDKDVVFDAMVATATDEDCAGTTGEDIANNNAATGAIIHVDARRIEIVKKIVLDANTAFGPIALHKNSTHIFGFETDVVDAVVSDEVFVSRKLNGRIGTVMDVVVCCANAYA